MMMNTIETPSKIFAEWFNDRMREINISVEELKEATGLSKKTIYEIKNAKKTKIRKDTIERLAPGIEFTPEELYEIIIQLKEKEKTIKVIHPWGDVQEDGRKFIEEINYPSDFFWFRIPLGGLIYQTAFNNFLKPALDNHNIKNIFFLLDLNNEELRDKWHDFVIPMIEEWGKNKEDVEIEFSKHSRIKEHNNGNILIKDIKKKDSIPQKIVWCFISLAKEFAPPFKIIRSVSEPDKARAQIFLGTEISSFVDKKGSIQKADVPSAIISVIDHLEIIKQLNETIRKLGDVWRYAATGT